MMIGLASGFDLATLIADAGFFIDFMVFMATFCGLDGASFLIDFVAFVAAICGADDARCPCIKFTQQRWE